MNALLEEERLQLDAAKSALANAQEEGTREVRSLILHHGCSVIADAY
jgi:hypothetical protein